MATRDIGKRALRKLFELGQRIGVDILPRHFYSSIPDVRSLKKASAWRVPRSMAGVAGKDLDEQVRRFADCFSAETVELLRVSDVYGDACKANGAVGYGPIEGEVLYAYVRTHRPRKVVQVGAGVSTAIILRAAQDAGYRADVTCVDPFPTSYLEEAGGRGEIRLLDVPAQEVPLEELTGVGEDGLLFVDSTHTVKPGSEVNKIILDALPLMSEGSTAHFHDITFPYDYHPDILDKALFFAEETALLLAYLSENRRARILFSMSMLHHARAEAITELLPRYVPAGNEHGVRTWDGHFPSSTYIKFG